MQAVYVCPGASSSVELNGCFFQQELVAGSGFSLKGLHHPLIRLAATGGLNLKENAKIKGTVSMGEMMS